MMPNEAQPTIARFPRAATAAYTALVLLFALGTWNAIADLFDRRFALAAAQEHFERLESSVQSRNIGSGASGAATASLLLDGATVTVAGASLLQHVAGAVAKADGNVVSSQLDLQGVHSKAGFVSAITSCEVDQSALQDLLYDLEAGLPFVFIDQLVVQAPATSSVNQEARMRVLLRVSAMWQGGQ
jgi:general secretion pathway protein M